MGKSKRKTKKSSIKTITILLIYLLVISLIGYFTINNFYKMKKVNKEYKIVKEKYNKLNNEYNNTIKNTDRISKELKEVKNTSKKLEETKNEVFSLAKELETKIKNNESNAKIAYLTFDDGPYYLTDNVLNVLNEKKVKATFFTIGLNKDPCYDNKAVSCYGTYKRIVDSGHTIANHTYSHAIFGGLYSSSSNFLSDIEKQEQLILERTGYKTNIVRFPGGSSTAKGLKNDIINGLRERGYGWVDWTAGDGDGGSLASTDQAWNNLVNTINSNIEVILFHDYNRFTNAILPDAITYLEDNGYIILPLFYDSVMINK